MPSSEWTAQYPRTRRIAQLKMPTTTAWSMRAAWSSKTQHRPSKLGLQEQQRLPESDQRGRLGWVLGAQGAEAPHITPVTVLPLDFHKSGHKSEPRPLNSTRTKITKSGMQFAEPSRTVPSSTTQVVRGSTQAHDSLVAITSQTKRQGSRCLASRSYTRTASSSNAVKRNGFTTSARDASLINFLACYH